MAEGAFVTQSHCIGVLHVGQDGNTKTHSARFAQWGNNGRFAGATRVYRALFTLHPSDLQARKSRLQRTLCQIRSRWLAVDYNKRDRHAVAIALGTTCRQTREYAGTPRCDDFTRRRFPRRAAYCAQPPHDEEAVTARLFVALIRHRTLRRNVLKTAVTAHPV